MTDRDTALRGSEIIERHANLFSIEDLRTLRAALTSAAAEPIGYIHVGSEDEGRNSCVIFTEKETQTPGILKDGDRWQPVYDHPPSPDSQQQDAEFWHAIAKGLYKVLFDVAHGNPNRSVYGLDEALSAFNEAEKENKG